MMTVYSITYFDPDGDGGRGEWRNDYYDDGLFLRKEDAQKIVADRNLKIENDIRTAIVSNNKRLVDDRDRKIKEHDALVAAGLRDSCEWPELRLQDVEKALTNRWRPMWDVEEHEVKS